MSLHAIAAVARRASARVRRTKPFREVRDPAVELKFHPQRRVRHANDHARVTRLCPEVPGLAVELKFHPQAPGLAAELRFHLQRRVRHASAHARVTRLYREELGRADLNSDVLLKDHLT